jgi:hypothetical protein
MAGLDLTVVITTYNRSALVVRAVESVLAQASRDVEVLVVDDASGDDTAAALARYGDRCRVLVQPQNSGVNAARNRALQEARGAWALVIDDDWTLLPDALATVEHAVESFAHADRYPVLKFGSSETIVPTPFAVLDFEGYERLQGDLVPLIRRHRFFELGYAYPPSRLGAEHLLWLRIAARNGVPTWAARIVRIHYDAPGRLTDFATQVARARDHALLQEETLTELDDIMPPDYRAKRRLAAATYWLVAGDRARARGHLAALPGRTRRGSLLWLLTVLAPKPLVRAAFVRYRRRERDRIRRRLREAAGRP